MVDEYDAFSNKYIGTKVRGDLTVKKEGSKESVAQSQKTLVRYFWSYLKKMVSVTTEPVGGLKIYITGVLPLCLVDYTNGFNIKTNISFKEEFAGFCGLTGDEVKEALQVIFVEKENMAAPIAEYVEIAKRYYNSYYFCNSAKVPTVFNTNTYLEYLKVSSKHYMLIVFIADTSCVQFHKSIKDSQKCNLERLSNSEISETVLEVLSNLDVLNNILQRIFDKASVSEESVRWNFSFQAKAITHKFHKRNLVK
jgi:hypothetical protein